MADIIVNDIHKRFDQDREILSGVSFHIDAGERVALLGDNGAGKTTMMRILTGELSPDAGSVTLARGKRVGYVAQMNSLTSTDTAEDVLRSAYSDVTRAARLLEEMHSDMSAVSAAHYDETLRAFESRNGYGWEAEMNRIAGGLGITGEMRSARFSSLSGGEQTRVNLARMIMEAPDILLLDEPTNHLDTASLEWLEDHLLHFKGSVLVISHDRYFLDAVAQRVIELRRGEAEFYTGNYSAYVKEKELRFQQQLLRYQQQQAKIHQLEFQIARLKAWGSVYDNPSLHKKAAAMEKRIERTRQTDKPVQTVRMRSTFSSEAFRADRVLELISLSKRFDSKVLFENVSALIRGGGERVALVGGNGCGKTTLLKIILDELAPDKGRVVLGPSVRVAYLPQQITFAHPQRTLYDTLLYETGCSPQEARDRLGAFRFSGEDQFKKVEQLSGGEKTRLKLCILMLRRANLLILDEPTNHLDLSSREWIEEAVSLFEGTLLFVSHDRYFIKRFANRVWELENGFHDYDRDWEGYRRTKALNEMQKKQEQKTEKAKEKPEVKQPSPAVPKAGPDPKTQRRINALERDIARKEEALSAFDDRMEAAARDYTELMRLQAEKEALQAQIDSLLDEWERLNGG